MVVISSCGGGTGAHAGLPARENHASLFRPANEGGTEGRQFTATRYSSRFGREPISEGKDFRWLNEAWKGWISQN